MATGNSRLAGIRGEWQANPRLRWGVLAIGVIAWVYAVLLLNDLRLKLHEDYRQQTLRLYKVAALAGKDEWIGRAQDAKALRRALDSQVPGASSTGMAQADAQGWVKALVNATGPKLTTEGRDATRVDPASGLWKVPMTLRGTTEPGPLLEMLRQIESSERLVVVESLEINNRQRMNLQITIAPYYRLKQEGGADVR